MIEEMEGFDRINPQTIDEVVRDLNKIIDQMRKLKHDQTQISNNMVGMTVVYNRLLEKLDAIDAVHAVGGSMQEKIQELRDWKKEIDKITPGPVLTEMVDEMRKSRDLRIKIYAILGIGVFINIILNVLQWISKH